MVPTKRLWFLLFLGFPVGIAAGMLNNLALFWTYNAGLLGVAWITTLIAPDPRKTLRIRRKFDPVLSVRVPNSIEVEILNDGVAPISGLLRDEPPPFFTASTREFPLALNAGRQTTVSYQITPPERGTDYFRGTFLRQNCPLGLATRDVKLTTEQPIRVYPNVLALREFDLLKQKGKLREMGIRISRQRGLGTEFESLRDYADGDDFRKIDWKASARRGKLIVRQYEQERNQPVIVCIDVGRRMLSEVEGVTKLDHVLDSLLMLVHAASHAGDLVGILVYSDRVVRYIPPRKGRNQMGAIIEAVHDLLPEPCESDPIGAFAYLAAKWKRRALVVVFSDVENSDEARALAVALSPLSNRHIVLLGRVADPRLKELTEVPLSEPRDLYSKAAALLFTEERKRAGSTLDSFGVHSLESEPQDLAGALVSFYFYVKDRSLL